MAAKKVEIEVDVTGNIVESEKNLRNLKRALKEVPAGTAEWGKIKNQIRDVEDALESAGQSSEDFKGLLESAPGPLGQLGKGIKQVELATKSFGAALKATGIGLLVSTIGLLVGAFAKTEGSLKKLEPVMIGLEKILGGLVEAFMPLIEGFAELAMEILPYVTKGISMYYGALMGLFTLVKEQGVGIGKILKGIFTLDTTSLQEGWDQIKNSFSAAADTYQNFQENFEKGTKKMTETEKKNAEEAKKLAEEALQRKLKQMETQDKLDAAQMAKLKEQAMALATTEQQKFDVERKFAEMSYNQAIKDIEDKQKLYKKDSDEFKQLQADKIKLEGDYIKQQSEFKTKQIEITKNTNKELLDAEIQALNLKKAQGTIKEDEYQKSLYEINKKYLTDKKELGASEIAYQTYLTEQKKKNLEIERGILFQGLQDQIDALDRKNTLAELDFEEDNKRLLDKKAFLQQQRDLELQAAKDDAQKQLEIRKKYADEIYNVDQQITNNQRAQAEQRLAIQNAQLDVFAQFGAFLQQVAGKNKALAKAGLIVEQAAGVARIIVNTAAANAKAVAASPLTGGMPWVAINTASGALSIASAIAATVKGIQQINQADSGSGGGGGTPQAPNLGRNYATGGLISGPGTSTSDSIPINVSNGEAVMTAGAVTMFKPLLSMMNQMGGGTSFNRGVGVSLPDNPKVQTNIDPMIIKTYVVSNELTNESEKQARLKDLSTL